jgi:ubiquinone/menaquinone biosynthesis C-methylase UbiE
VLNELKNCKDKKKLLDVASGPLHIKEFLEYSKSFSERHCVDFSKIALEKAKLNLIKNGQKRCFFYNINFLKSNFKINQFNCAISLHTLYHIDINKQKEFINKLIKCVKPNGLVIIVYSNPFSLQSILTTPMFIWREFKSLIKNILIKLSFIKTKNNSLYFKRKSIFWWNNFKKLGEVKIIAERTFSASFEKNIIPNNSFGKKVYDFLFYLEHFAFWKYFSTYYIVIIKKK